MNRSLVVLGAGESGVGSAILAQKQGFDVFVSDMGNISDKYKSMLEQYGISYEEGAHTHDKIFSADEVVKSPGIPDSAPLIVELKDKNIPVISEIEFAGRYTNAKKICITGSNGKTTTTSLLYFMLQNAGLNVGLAGNIGKSFAFQVATEDYDFYVLELSSFQLDGMYDFKADIAILLNITPDHLDRYDYDINKYAESKFRIVRNLTEEECFIFCADDEITLSTLERIVCKAKELPFSIDKSVEKGGCVENENLKINAGSEMFVMPAKDLSLKGKHNRYNSLAAGIAANVLNIRNEVIRESLMGFTAVEHRLEPVISVGGVKFINDSKATNINSTWYALESMSENVVWIVGGIDKGNDYTELYELVKQKVKAIVCMGTDNTKIIEAFKDMIPVIKESKSAEEAVNISYELAEKGDTVLLSPACASFDLFDNYEDRGVKFKNAVRDL
ncbi:MAG: UDP-N-acetylmuramoyl-L-alanine--D-glutamate ligase [Bacteroidales bacterium]|jgi:UDP-N-acetylmuramoylalanine--D-glutamate ligase|nr:UDP-N-acetylmuramoyl-L-alanine--D-glutamate ligase [Bacteroidales bacterium]